MYQIEILDSTATETRLKDKHKYADEQLEALKSYTTDELKALEMSLGNMSLHTLQKFKDVHMGRQDISIEAKRTKRGRRTVTIYKPIPKRYGRTLHRNNHTTILFFDFAFKDQNILFTGGLYGVRLPSVRRFAHELGHVVEETAGIKAAFNKFVKAKRINPITWYAKSDKTKEFFPEAFALYHTDPEWMKTNLPALYQWFETLSQTGKPPTP